jgi:hypothetical protein
MYHYIYNVLVLESVVCVLAGAVTGTVEEALFVRRDHLGRPLGGGEEEELSVCAVGCLGNLQSQGFLLENGACADVDDPMACAYAPNPCFLLEGIPVPALPRHVNGTLHVTNGVAAGDFSPAAFCAAGSYAAGFRMRAVRDLPGIDDAAVSAILLSCASAATLGQVANVTSHPGWNGEWQEQADCPPDYWITSFMLRVSGREGVWVSGVGCGCVDVGVWM